MNAERCLLAGEALGLGYAALKKSTDYARDRIVFGRPIGQNQAIQHPLADAYMHLEAAKLEECDVVVGATGDDKANLVVSLLAKTEFAVRRVVARINHPANEWLFTEAWGVDVAVSTPRVLASLVEEAVEVGDVVRLFGIREGQANLVEMTLPRTRRVPATPSAISTCRKTPRW